MRRAASRFAAALLLAIVHAAAAQPVITPVGSPFGLAPPPGYIADTTSTGFIDPVRPGASIAISEMPAAAYAQIERGMTDEALARTGIAPASRESFATPAGTGLLITGTQRAGERTFSKWMLVVLAGTGAEGATGLIVVTLPRSEADAADPAADRTIRDALATLAFTPLSLEQKRAALPFQVSDGPTLKLGNILGGNSAVLTPGGRQGTPGNPLLAIAFARGAPVAPADRATAALVLSRQLGGLSEVRRTPPAEAGDRMRIDGTGRSHDGSVRRFTQWVVFLPEGYLRILAMADEDQFGALAAEFDTIAESVARR